MRGPSFAVDATCASGLLAVHLACQSLRSRESELALAAGASLMLNADMSAALAQGGVLSPTGTCRFGEVTADGYGRGEGVAAVLLKPLDRALADGNPVRAVLLGSAMTSNGRARSGMASPSVDGQRDVLHRAHLDAGIAPSDVDYVEAHGTGTAVGDRVELTALAQALGQGRQPDRPCLVGSVKSNVGHTEPTAGIVGLLKVALCMQHGWIPRTLHVDTPNPVLEQTGHVLRLARTAVPWPRHENRPELAGISCLGATGSNTHAVIGAAPALRSGTEPYTGLLTLPLSARGPDALQQLARRYLRLLDREQDTGRLRDVCYSAGAHRMHHELRSAVVALDGEGLLDGLRAIAWGSCSQAVVTGRAVLPAPRMVWSFPDHGAHPVAIARQPRVRSWTMQVAAAAVLRDWGIEPDLLRGEGTGRIAIATVNGDISDEEAAALIADGGEVRLPRHVTAGADAGHADERPVLDIEIGGDRLEPASLHRALAEAYVAGWRLRWDRVQPGGSYTRIPTYPWQRRRYWVTSGSSQSGPITHPPGARRAS
ncbi:MAG: beta-ketoacyl synthase N-terminal-like domain-containing protein [Pseudonocardiaceae bacterium]